MWFNRNRTRLGNPRQQPKEVLSQARFMLDEFQLAHHRPSVLKDAMDNRWVPPAYPWYKIDTVAAVFSQVGMVGIATGSFEAEAKAMDEAAFFAADIGIRDAIFESDSQAVYLTLMGSTPTHASIDNIIASIHHKMHEFRTFNFSHVKRQGNRPAHLLASFYKGIYSNVTWLEETPYFTESSTLHDAMYLSSLQ